MAVHASRPDLQLAFPHPEAADADAYRAWTVQRRQYEPDAPALAPAARALRPEWTDASREPGGVNLIGYLGFDKSLGDVARRLLAALEAAHVPVAALDYHRSGSPRTATPPSLGTSLVYDTNLLVINADQQANVAADYGSILYPGRRTIAYWFWDVAHVPETMLPAFDHVDAVWVATDFTAEALRSVTDKPVTTMPIPVPMPERSASTRADLGLRADRFVFLVTFDHLSVTERKNPLAAIDAFRRAFPDPTPSGPVLVVKSINAAHRPAQHDWLRQAAAGRPDVIVTDRHLSRGDQMALVAESDCVVSLHRTEGLGLHLIEAMWFAKPTIATRYSGNLAFMNDENSALVDATLVPVTHGEGYFPAAAEWADPDLEQAADWMRRIAADPALAAQLGRAGRTTMERQPSLADTGRAIVAALAMVPVRSAGEPAPPAKNVAMSVKRRVGWVLRGGANERAALDDHAAAIRDLQRAVSDLTETVARIDRKLVPDDGEAARRLDDIERRIAQIGDVVAAGTLERSATPDAGARRSSGGNGG
jgi:glycosyltransferase involved in cell wall biosynthesis